MTRPLLLATALLGLAASGAASTAAAQNFSPLAAPNPLTLTVGGPGATVTVTTNPNGPVLEPVTYSFLGLPAFVQTVGPQVALPPYPPALFPFALAGGAVPGTYTGALRGVTAVETVEVPFQVIVRPPPAFSATVGPNPLALTVGGGGAVVTVGTLADPGFTAPITYSFDGLPPFVTFGAAQGLQISIPTASLAGVITLLPGLTTTVAMTELASRHLSSGSARLSSAFIVFAAMTFGVALGTTVVTAIYGGPVRSFSPERLPAWTQFVALALAPLSLKAMAPKAPPPEARPPETKPPEARPPETKPPEVVTPTPAPSTTSHVVPTGQSTAAHGLGSIGWHEATPSITTHSLPSRQETAAQSLGPRGWHSARPSTTTHSVPSRHSTAAHSGAATG